jgi:hypothetical protein
MIRMLLIPAAFLATVFANLSVSVADVVYDNGLLPFGNFATGSDVALNNSVAENFQFSEHTNVNKIEFLGLYYKGAIDDRFTVEFYNDLSGLPGALLSTPTILSSLRTLGFSAGSLQVFHYELQLSDSLFEAGQKYWVSVTNDSSLTPEKDHWSWASTAASSGDGSAVIDPSWRAREFDFAFRLHGFTVPEPAAAMLIALGAVFGLAIRR